MSRIGRLSARGTALRAVLAVAFVALFALQPGLFAVANASGMHDPVAVEASSGERDHHASSHGADHHAHALANDQATDFDHHGARKTGDKSCEVHCAPAQAMLVEFAALPQPLRGCFGRAAEEALICGVTPEFIKPPRT